MNRVALLAGTALLSILCPASIAAAQSEGAVSQQNPQPNQSPDPKQAAAAAGNSSASSDGTTASTAPGTQGAVANANVNVDNQAIIVTGSRIARRELATVQPTQVIGSKQIETRGYTNITQALQELPAFGPPGNSSVGAQSSFGPSQSFVDFFGLGSQRTLTLVNGRRFVSSNTASIFGPVSAGSQVDLNNIPVTLIDRVDVVAVGGAPIYGSDAIAGTVNIVLKKNFEGVEVGGNYGLSKYGDGADRRANILAGKNFADGRGNIVISGEYDKVSGFTSGDRTIASPGLFFGTPPASANSATARRLYPGQRYSAFTSGGVPFTDDDYLVSRSGIRDASGNPLQFGSNGTLVPLDLGTVLRQGYISSGGNGFDIPSQSNLLTNSERYLATALGSYEFTDHIRAFGEAWYSRNSGTNLIDQPNYNTALFDAAGTADGNIIANINNPYLSGADRATIAANLAPGQTDFYVGRALSDLTTGRSKGIVETYRFVGGFSGDFNVGSHPFTWEASANYGHSRADGRNLELVQQNFANALDAVAGADGTITCRPGYTNATIATLSSTCAPLNIFGAGQASQAAKDYIFAVARPVSQNSQLVLNANMQGSLFKMPGGDVKFSLGFEHRREKTQFDPGDYYFGEPQADGTRTQYGRTIPIDPIRGSFHTNEVFGELTVPVISPETGFRFIKTLELDGAARYVDNSLSGGDVTWTAGGRLGFVEDFTFRGNFTRSIRNPAITEVFNPTSRAFDSGNDPCDANYVNSGLNPANRRANCVAAGITDPDNFVSDFSNFTIPVTVAGNTQLTSEKANSWTAGVTVTPTFLHGFTATADWVSIKLKDAITQLGGTDILNACYDGAAFPNSFCGAVDRDPATGQISTIREGYFNAASYTFQGLTSTLSYQRPIGTLGTFGISLNYLYRDKLATRARNGRRQQSRRRDRISAPQRHRELHVQEGWPKRARPGPGLRQGQVRCR